MTLCHPLRGGRQCDNKLRRSSRHGVPLLAVGLLYPWRPFGERDNSELNIRNAFGIQREAGR